MTEFINLFLDNPDKELVETVKYILREYLKFWMENEFQAFLNNCSHHNISKSVLWIYFHLLKNQTVFDNHYETAMFKERVFRSKNELYEFIRELIIKNKENQILVTKHIPVDRSQFFGKDKILDKLLKADLIKEKTVYGKHKHKQSIPIILKFPKPKLPLCYYRRVFNDKSDNYDLESVTILDFDIVEFLNKLELFLEKDDEYNPYYRNLLRIDLPDDPNIELMSLLDVLLRRIPGVELAYFIKLFKNMFNRIKNEKRIKKKKRLKKEKAKKEKEKKKKKKEIDSNQTQTKTKTKIKTKMNSNNEEIYGAFEKNKNI